MGRSVSILVKERKWFGKLGTTTVLLYLLDGLGFHGLINILSPELPSD